MTKEKCEIETSKAIMEMRNHIEKLGKENVELQEQVEKMKCCLNCKHDSHCNHRVCDKGLQLWELRR